MGEMADLYDYECIDDGWETTAEDYLDMSDDELRNKTSKSRNPKIMGIRTYCGNLSEKQRWCLANYIAEHDRYF